MKWLFKASSINRITSKPIARIQKKFADANGCSKLEVCTAELGKWNQQGSQHWNAVFKKYVQNQLFLVL